MSEGRGQFTFYRSFWEAAKLIKKPADRLAFIEAICAFALDEDERPLADTIAPSFLLVKPTLLSSAKKAKSGRAGGTRKQTEANAKQTEANAKQTEANAKQTEANAKQTEANAKRGETQSEKEKEKEKEIEKEIENEVENECIKQEAALAEVMNLYLDKINPTPSQICVDELKEYVKSLGAEVVLHALKIALDERKVSWSYIRAILQRYESEGLRTLNDVLRQEQQHANRKAASDRAGRYSVIMGADLDE